MKKTFPNVVVDLSSLILVDGTLPACAHFQSKVFLWLDL